MNVAAVGACEDGVRITRAARPGVAVVELARTARLNALDAATADRLGRHLVQLGEDPQVGAVVITGSGSAFCSGDDLHEVAAVTAEAFRRGVEALQRITLAVVESPVPVIAAINGAALGAGLELTLGCDVRLAAESATFGLPEIRWGLSVTNGASVLLPRLIGEEQARRVILGGQVHDSAWARSAGLVMEVVPDGELRARALTLASEFADRPAEVVAATRRLLSRPDELKAALTRETATVCAVREGEYAHRALAAFAARSASRRSQREGSRQEPAQQDNGQPGESWGAVSNGEAT